MRKKIKNIVYIFLGTLGLSVSAKENVNATSGQVNGNPTAVLAFNCAAGTAQTLLDINNVKTNILNGGDMWWDLSNGRYEIPKNSGKHSIFSGALWIGGYDENGMLKVAAQTYRQTGNDYWPGPLDNVRLTSSGEFNSNYGQTSSDVCAEYDQHFVITRAEVEEFVAYTQSENPAADFPDYVIPESILDYPGNRTTDDMTDAFEGYDEQVGTSPYYALETMAPFRDVNNDGFYDPIAGDYPDYNIDATKNCKEDDMLFGDQTLWWVYNDNGNIHTESGSETAIGIEIQAQAFAFATNDEINNMTFYNYKLINRSHSALNETYFGVWVDPDLGEYQDDFVGCDVGRGLGYCYNGDENDEGAAGYGINPPAIGVDFFRGPLADPTYETVTDSLGNDTTIVTNAGELLMMSKFVYYNNTQGNIDSNPDQASDFYNYLDGKWRNFQPMTYGGDGLDPANPECNFMFPGDTDPAFPGQNWTEQTADNIPDDRRFLQSAGKFTLAPGAVNTITTGVVWARASEGGAFASVELMKLADDKAQKLFDVCFEVLDGPDAPNLTIQELDEEVIISISNSQSSNNFMEAYQENDEVGIIGYYDTEQTLPYNNEFLFEGYQIFQLRDETVTASDVYEIDKARLVFQCDVKNFRSGTNGNITTLENESPIAQLINFNFDQELDASVPQNMTINAANEGITHSFSFTQDQFAEGDRTLVNNKTYYFTAIAYAYNEYLEYQQDLAPDPNDIYAPSYNGQKKPFLAGRKNIKQYSAIPHMTYAEADGTIQNADYGTIPNMTRIEGKGNGGIALEFTAETRAQILSDYCVEQTGYDVNAGPVNIKVYDPLMVPANNNFVFKMDDKDDDANWFLANITTGDTVFSETTIELKNEQLIPQWGLSVTIQNVANPGGAEAVNNGFISVEEIKSDRTTWLNYARDNDDLISFINGDGTSVFVVDAFNWIRAGTDSSDVLGVDEDQVYESLLNGSWAPYRLVAAQSDVSPHAMAYPSGQSQSTLATTPSVDIVFTSDKSLWTRVPVIETGDVTDRLQLKDSPSVDKDGNVQADLPTGFSYFPGYALDLENGTRLNMMFGEASDQPENNGDDMIWNPTSATTEGFYGASFTPNPDDTYDVYLGGRHYIYVMKTVYAGDNPENHPNYANLPNMASSQNAQKVFRNAAWVSVPLLSENATLLDGDIEVKIRVAREYDDYVMDNTDCELNDPTNNGNPYLTFNTTQIGAVLNDASTASSALDLIKIVPNPYYGSNNYEKDQIDNKVKITNLPSTCTISIYNVGGTLVRKVNLDSENNVKGWDWDLKNNDNVSIASGIYIIHVDAGEKGQKILKWFGALRPVDLESF